MQLILAVLASVAVVNAHCEIIICIFLLLWAEYHLESPCSISGTMVYVAFMIRFILTEFTISPLLPG